MSAVERPLDIVIKTHVYDAVPFAQLQRDLAAHSRLHGRVYVIVPRNERDQFAGLIGENCIVLTAEEVASAAGYAGEFPDSWTQILSSDLISTSGTFFPVASMSMP